MYTEIVSSLRSVIVPRSIELLGYGFLGCAKKLCLGLLLVAGLGELHHVWADNSPQVKAPEYSVSAQHAAQIRAAEVYQRADFRDEAVSLPAWHLANWVIHSGDNADMPFIIVDKVQAKVMVFDAKGQLNGAASALLGLAIGDDSVPGIGDRRLSNIRPEERTTPAGRFVASLGLNLAGEEVLWVDYSLALSLHRVITDNVRERRAERLNSPHIEDNRISYGCINVPVEFFEDIVMPAFTGTSGIVYTLPETRHNRRVFDAYYEFEIE